MTQSFDSVHIQMTVTMYLYMTCIYMYSKLCSSFIKFARRHSAEICKYRVSIRTHMVERICIPLDVRHDLVRNVTTRGRGRGNTCT